MPVLLLAALACGQWLETVIPLPASALCYGPVNNKVYCSSTTSSALVVIDGATNQRIKTISDAGGGPLLYNPAANAVYSGMYWDSAMVVVDCSSDAVVSRTKIGGQPRALCYVPGSYHPAVACACDLAGKVVIVDAQHHNVVDEFDVGSGPQSMCWDTHLGRLFCANRWDSTVTTARGEVGRDIWFVEAWLDVGRCPDGLCLDSTDAKAYCGTDDRGVAVITTSLDVTHVPTGRYSVPACYNPRQNMVYCTDRDTFDSTVTVIDCSTDVVVATVVVGNRPKLAYYNSINNKVYCVNYKSCDVSVIDCATNEVLVTIPVDSGPTAITWNTAQNRTYVSCAGGIYVIRDSMPSGVEERSTLHASRPTPTIVSGASGVKRLASSVIFDATGRRVANPHSGVFFIRERTAVSGGRSAVAVRKVVIQR